ncbi:protocatechuate 3,4-dioxygenase [Ideonella azotifigens]|uniref:Protocatechuate 4,5-dioxygenase subunit alpha n=1 Tax=Ideonella azotifigens TaxID=513160 RepID=A0ABN1JUR5_9BURK|nr:protocatechuate 3,4-dioxygenase [Ideonella azotifigens]MCD2341166.1 protocatechuate 3,4-dioxygenase [Ideonella azotifigens]
MNPQVEGMAALGGTYVFDLRVSNRTLKLNRFFWNMINAEARDAYLADSERSMSNAGLSDGEKAMIRRLDWIALVRHGVNFFVLEKFARVVKTPNLVVYALMRGETFEAFMRTRQVPSLR